MAGRIGWDDRQISVVFLLLAFISAGLVLTWKYHSLEIANLGVFFIKLLPFVFALIGIGYLPEHWFKPPWSLLLVMASFAFIFCYSVAMLIIIYFDPNWEKFYLILQMMVAFIILALAFAFRMGGGRKKEVFVFGSTTLIFMLSGIEDLTSHILQIFLDPDITALPEKWDWARHMTVFFGRVLNKAEALLFIAAHFLIITLILVFSYGPGNRLLQKVFRKNSV